MYYQYFGLNEAPFSISVNPRYLFMSARHRDALAHLLYGVGQGGGFILLTGEVGTGKTTINRCLLEQLPHDTDIAIILNPALNAMELLASVCDELGIDYDPDNHSLKTLTDKLHAFLLDNYSRGRKTVLLIDEAQHLDFEVLEQIRLLTNLETHDEKLLQIILIGQPELAQMLARPELRQLNQRITARYNLEPLNREETGAYIRHRLQVAGMSADREVFPASVVTGIYRQTRGIPRLINVLCDRILLGAYGRNKNKADKAMLRLAVREVMGEEYPEPASPRWPYAVALLALFTVVIGFGWQERERFALALNPEQEQTPALVESPGPEDGPADAGAPVAMTPIVAPDESYGDENSSIDSEDGLVAPPAIVTPPTDDWLLPPPDALSLFWSLHSGEPLPQALCSQQTEPDCIERTGESFDELAALDRPLLLEMRTPQRFIAATLLLGTDGVDAWVKTGSGMTQLPATDIARLWTGSYRLLWHPPAGFQHALSEGDKSPVVEQVAALFARLDSAPHSLAGMNFNASLAERVLLFQRQHNLVSDGVIGTQTLLKLNELLAIDITAEAARAWLEASAESVLPPDPSLATAASE